MIHCGSLYNLKQLVAIFGNYDFSSYEGGLCSKEKIVVLNIVDYNINATLYTYLVILTSKGIFRTLGWSDISEFEKHLEKI